MILSGESATLCSASCSARDLAIVDLSVEYALGWTCAGLKFTPESAIPSAAAKTSPVDPEKECAMRMLFPSRVRLKWDIFAGRSVSDRFGTYELIGSTSVPSTSTAMERISTSMEITTRHLSFLRDRLRSALITG